MPPERQTGRENFDELVERRGSSSLKWERYRGTDIQPMWVADMDFRSPPAVLKLLRERVEHGVFGYTLPPAELVDAVLSMLLAEYDWQVRPEWLVWLPGLVCGLNVSCRAVGQQGDEVLSMVPIYPPFLTAPGHSGRRLSTAPFVRRGASWEFDFDLLAGALTPRTRLFLHCNPQNPLGRVFSRVEQEQLAEFCLRHDLVVCSDEIHCGLVLDRDKKHIPFATLSPEVARRTITLMAPSKTYNLPGLGCSFAVISEPGLRLAFKRVMEGIVPYVNALGFTAALAAYRDSADWLRALIGYLRANRDLVLREVEEMPGITTTPVEATYLAWLDCRASGLAEPARFFEEEARVGLSDGREFGAPGFLRLNFGCPRSELAAALRRMGEALEGKGVEQGSKGARE